MAGHGLPQGEKLSIVLQNKLVKNGYNIKIINGSVSGSTSASGLNRVEWSLSEPNINLMILGLGANDMLRGISPTETETNLEKIIQKLKQKNIDVILAGMIAPTTHGFNYKKKFDNIYPSLAKKYNLDLIPFLLEGVVLKPELNQDDGMHPNAKGTLIISDTLEKSIISFIKK
jgi:acyl-CoA thioesterase-1